MECWIDGGGGREGEGGMAEGGAANELTEYNLKINTIKKKLNNHQKMQ